MNDGGRSPEAMLAGMALGEKAAELNCVVRLRSRERIGAGLAVAARWRGALASLCVGPVCGVLRPDPRSGVTLASGFGAGKGLDGPSAGGRGETRGRR